MVWIRAANWLPYQRDTFVTPPFAGYISGHSTFSRAAAEVLAARLPHAESVTIPGAGHIVNIEEPEAFDAAAIRFLERVRAPAD